MKKFQIEIPGTVVVAGTLGLALQVTAQIEATINPDGTEVDGDEAICRAYRAFPAENLPGAHLCLQQALPEGLGGDAQLGVAGLAAAAAATETKEARQTILRVATEMSGDISRTAAALMGGVSVAVKEADGVKALYVANHLAMGVALFLPKGRIQVAEPPDRDQIAYLTTALIWGRWDAIGSLAPPIIDPALQEVAGAARESGAYGIFSDAHALVALTPMGEGEAVRGAMEERARKQGVPGTTLATGVREAGVTVKAIKEETEEEPGSQT